MNWTNVKLVFLREVRDQLRDRRTLFMVAVLPLLLYPALGLGMFQMTTLFREQPRTVVILGADDLPDPALVEDGRFLSEYFDVAADAARLRVITDAAGRQEPAAEQTRDDDEPLTQSDPPEQTVVADARALRQQIGELAELESQQQAALEREEPAAARRLEQQIDPLKTQILAGMAHSGIDVLILVPPGLREQVAEMNLRLAEQRPAAVDLQTPRLQIVRNSADDKSASAYRRVNDVISSWEQTLLRQRLEAAELPPSLSRPIDAAPIELAQDEQVAANMWSKLFPALLIIMSVTGAFYPAIDLGAGEKERGTMETLLISPATRTEIVTGKFFTVLLFSLGTAMLNLMSMGLTGRHVLSMQRDAAGSLLGGAPLPPLASLIWVLILAVPMAALFSSLSLGLAMFARSSKEGQYYLTPLLLVTMGLSVMAVSPMYEITPFLSVMPVVGPALLLKGLLLAPADPSSLYAYMIPVLVSSIGYSVLGLWWAVELFQREDILFRGDDQFELKAWIRHLLRDKEPLPSFSEGVFCFVLIMLLQFIGMRFFGQAAAGADATRLMQILMIQQLVIIATPPLLMAIMLTTSVRRTLKLHGAPLKYFAAAIVLAIVLRPLSTELVMYLQEINFLPSLDPETAEKLASMFDLSQAGWLVFLAFAVAPGICEEVAFRGFILSGLSQGGRTGLAIVLSALAFGIMHLIPQQVFNASLLGLVLGLITLRSGSLLPGILFHILYNGSEVLRNRIAPDVWTTGPAPWFFTFEIIEDQPQVGHTWLLLSVCAIVAAGVLTWLIRDERPTSGQSNAMPGQAGWAT
jgi:sodium transport system permease protein